MFVGDSVARQISEVDQDIAPCQTVEVFSDASGIYRTFEAGQADNDAATRSVNLRSGQQSRIQITQQQIQRLQNEKPAITVDVPNMESAMNAARGTQWLAALTTAGELQIRSLPDLGIVLQSKGLMASEPSFTDDHAGEVVSEDEEQDTVQQMLFTPIGKEHPRPHFLVSRILRFLSWIQLMIRHCTRQAGSTYTKLSLASRSTQRPSLVDLSRSDSERSIRLYCRSRRLHASSTT